MVFEGSVKSLNELFEGPICFRLAVEILEADDFPMGKGCIFFSLGIEEMYPGRIGGITIGDEDNGLVGVGDGRGDPAVVRLWFSGVWRSCVQPCVGARRPHHGGRDRENLIPGGLPCLRERKRFLFDWMGLLALGDNCHGLLCEMWGPE